MSRFLFSPLVMVLKLPKIVHFLQICAGLSKKPKYIKAIYFYPSERPDHALTQNFIFIGVRDINSLLNIAGLEQQHIPFDTLVHLHWHFMEVGKHAYQAG